MKRLMSCVLVALVLQITSVFALDQSSIPPKFSSYWGVNAGSTYIRSIPTTSQIGIQNCAASLPDGFPPLTFVPAGAGGCPPFGSDFNGILRQITQWSQWQGAGGPVFYDAAFSTSILGYPKSAMLMSSVVPGNIWMSTVDGNQTNPDDPATSLNWVQAPGQVQTGTPVQSLYTTAIAGHVTANGLTIGNASSNATNRANADTLFLYIKIWGGCPNTQCPIFTSVGTTSTRGASAIADYAANKALAVQNMNGLGLMGADSQNGTTSSFLSGVPTSTGTATVPGSIIGENFHVLITAELAAHIHQVFFRDPGHTHATPLSTATVGNGGTAFSGFAQTGAGSGQNVSFSGTGATIADQASAGGNLNQTVSTGSNQGHNTVMRTAVVYWNLKL